MDEINFVGGKRMDMSSTPTTTIRGKNSGRFKIRTCVGLHTCKIRGLDKIRGDMELWSKVVMGSGNSRRIFKNLMGRVRDMGGANITNLAFGGSTMFLTRKDQQCVEVWQSSSREF